MGFTYLNEEQKVRLALSKTACIIISDDMSAFSITSRSFFINTVFENFREESIASIKIYTERKRTEFEKILEGSGMDPSEKEKALGALLEHEKLAALDIVSNYKKDKYNTEVIRVKNDNYDYLQSISEEEGIYDEKPGVYIKCVIEDYVRRPFIERQRIICRKEYNLINDAIVSRKLLRVSVDFSGEAIVYIVYPYRILTDPTGFQEYLACYTRKTDESSKDKKIASFSMLRLRGAKISRLNSEAFISKNDLSELEKAIDERMAAFLLGEVSEIHVKFSKKGLEIYKKKLYLRPERNMELSHGNEGVFFCTEYQARNYFLSFGKEAEIISPASLRKEFVNIYSDAEKMYRNRKSSE